MKNSERESSDRFVPHGADIETLRTNTSRELYADLTNGIHPLSNPNLYEYLSNLSGYQRERLLERYLPKDLELKDINDEIAACFFHPGIAVRAFDFLRFADKTQKDGIKPLELIARYAEQLGQPLKLYRGMALTTAELQVIQTTQLYAPGMREVGLGMKIFEDILDPSLMPYGIELPRPNCFKADCVARITNDTPKQTSLGLSASIHRPVAASIGWHDSGRVPSDDLKLYVFELEVPKIMTYTEAEIMNDNRVPTNIVIEGKKYKDDLEVIVPFVILPEWIKGVSQEPTPPRWHPH